MRAQRLWRYEDGAERICPAGAVRGFKRARSLEKAPAQDGTKDATLGRDDRIVTRVHAPRKSRQSCATALEKASKARPHAPVRSRRCAELAGLQPGVVQGQSCNETQPANKSKQSVLSILFSICLWALQASRRGEQLTLYKRATLWHGEVLCGSDPGRTRVVARSVLIRFFGSLLTSVTITRNFQYLKLTIGRTMLVEEAGAHLRKTAREAQPAVATASQRTIFTRLLRSAALTIGWPTRSVSRKRCTSCSALPGRRAEWMSAWVGE